MNSTEKSSYYDNLEKMSTSDILNAINQLDSTVASKIKLEIPKINVLVDKVFSKLKIGGRLFYIGSGTSGRLGILDASEIPPTFGIQPNPIIALIAGGDSAVRKAIEFAEDDTNQAWIDLTKYDINNNDFVLGIAASGTTPYVIGGINKAKLYGIDTACITCNKNTVLSEIVDYPVEIDVGPEFITGSTRMKSGTAQKMVLNMISTSLMIKLGKIKGNKMIDMQLTNDKLYNRGIRMIIEELSVSGLDAEKLLKKHGSVRAVLEFDRLK